MFYELLVCLTVMYLSIFAVYDYGFQRRYVMVLAISVGTSPFAFYTGLLLNQLGVY